MPAEATDQSNHTRSVLSFRGTNREFKQMIHWLIWIDSCDHEVWDWDPSRRIWRRTTNRGGR